MGAEFADQTMRHQCCTSMYCPVSSSVLREKTTAGQAVLTIVYIVLSAAKSGVDARQRVID